MDTPTPIVYTTVTRRFLTSEADVTEAIRAALARELAERADALMLNLICDPLPAGAVRLPNGDVVLPPGYRPEKESQ